MTLQAVEETGPIPTLDCATAEVTGSMDEDSRHAWSKEAVAALEEAGCVRLLNAFEPDYLARLSSVRTNAPDAKTIGHAGPLGVLTAFEAVGRELTQRLYANQWVYPIVSRALGEDCILSHVGKLSPRVGMRGRLQEASLFGDDAFDAQMPAVGFGMVLPLSPGETAVRVWPGSQRVASDEQAQALPSVTVRLPLGSCLLFSARLLHGLSTAPAQDVHDTLYLAYHRRWFRGWAGAEREVSATTHATAFGAFSAQHQHLVEWQRDPYMRWRKREVAKRVASILPQGVLSHIARALKRAGG